MRKIKMFIFFCRQTQEHMTDFVPTWKLVFLTPFYGLFYVIENDIPRGGSHGSWQKKLH